jgi:hypothetical protein
MAWPLLLAVAAKEAKHSQGVSAIRQTNCSLIGFLLTTRPRARLRRWAQFCEAINFPAAVLETCATFLPDTAALVLSNTSGFLLQRQ